MAEAENLTDLHIADLHALAAEAGVNGYRMLSREELIAEIQAGGKRKRSRWPRRKAPTVDAESDTDELKIPSDAAAGADEGAEPEAERRPRRRGGRRGGRGRGGRDRERLASADRDDAPETEETEEITGILEVTRQRHGFLSVEGSDDDVYVSASQVRRCEMKDGDEVTGPVRAPRRGERHRALVRVNLVNGEPPVDAPAPRKPSGGGDASVRSRSGDAATSASVELTVVSVDSEQCVIEIEGSEHVLEPGDRLSIAVGDEDEAQVTRAER
jgi:transcription termination factor Rho